MSKRLLFAAIPNAVIDAYSSAAIAPCMFLTLVLLYKQADWATGVVKFTSASMLASRMQGQYSARTVQEALQNLHYAGWIISHHKKGSRRNYRVDLGNFTALTGAMKEQVLNPTRLRDWRNLEDTDRADDRAEDANFTSTETGNRNRDETATHQIPQEPKQESTTIQSPEKESLSLAPSVVSDSAETDGETLDWETLQDEEGDVAALHGRGLLVFIKQEFLRDHNYTRYDEEKLLPRYQKYFANREAESAQQFSNKIMIFLEWMTTIGKAAKIESHDAFFFHFENKSGRARGFRHQFEDWYAAAGKEKMPMKQLIKAAKRVRVSA